MTEAVVSFLVTPHSSAACPQVVVHPRATAAPPASPPATAPTPPPAGIAARFRTRLCETYEATRRCPYAYRCMFAHGRGQLRTATVNVADGLTSEAAVKTFQKNQQESAQRRKAQYAANHPGTPDQGARTLPGGKLPSSQSIAATPNHGHVGGAPGSPYTVELAAIIAADDLCPLPAPMHASYSPGAVKSTTQCHDPRGASAPLFDSILCDDDDEENNGSFVGVHDVAPNAAQRYVPRALPTAGANATAGTPFPTPDKHGASLSYPHPRFTGSDIHHYRPELVGTPPVTDLGHSLTTYMRTPNFNASVASIRSIDRSHGPAAGRRGSVASVGSVDVDCPAGGSTPPPAAMAHTPVSTPVRVRQHNPYALAPLTLPPATPGSPHRQTPHGSATLPRTSMSPLFAASPHSGGRTPRDAALHSPCYDEHATPSQSHHGLPRSVADSFCGRPASPSWPSPTQVGRNHINQQAAGLQYPPTWNGTPLSYGAMPPRCWCAPPACPGCGGVV
jgi:hypothetical protein